MFNPTSTRDLVAGPIIANCFFRRRLTYPFLGAISNGPNGSMAAMNASWTGRSAALGPE